MNIDENKEQVKHYILNLANKPYCSDDLKGLIIRPKETALRMRYLQHNRELSVTTLVIDFDHSESHYRWDDLKSPAPNMAIMNKMNGNSHLFYQLENKIYKNNEDHAKNLRKLSAIETAIIHKLDADKGYAGLISKNPTHDHWTTYFLKEEPYTLDEFEEYIDIGKSWKKQHTLFDGGVGRNCTLFELLRHEAYNVVKTYKFELPLEKLYQIMLAKAIRMNSTMFDTPLYEQELYHIAKSISKWTDRNMSASKFAKIQSRRGLKSGKVRAKQAENTYGMIWEIHLKQPQMSNREVAEILKVNEKTVRNAKKFYVEQRKEQSEKDTDQPELF